jgi:hypothetical protein
MFSSGRDKIERDRLPSNDLLIFEEDISKKNRKMNIVEIDNESARLTNFVIEISYLKVEKKESRLQDYGKKFIYSKNYRNLILQNQKLFELYPHLLFSRRYPY